MAKPTLKDLQIENEQLKGQNVELISENQRLSNESASFNQQIEQLKKHSELAIKDVKALAFDDAKQFKNILDELQAKLRETSKLTYSVCVLLGIDPEGSVNYTYEQLAAMLEKKFAEKE